jgi:hypothetical protein
LEKNKKFDITLEEKNNEINVNWQILINYLIFFSFFFNSKIL